MLTKDNNFKNLRNYVSLLNTTNKVILMLIWLNIYTIKCVECTRSVKDDPLDIRDLYSECVKYLEFYEYTDIELGSQEIARILQEYLDVQNYPLRVCYKVWGSSANEGSRHKLNGLIQIKFTIDKFIKNQTGFKYPSYLNQAFLFDPSDKSLHMFQTGMPFCKSLVLKLYADPENVDFYSTFNTECFLNPTQNITSLEKNKKITMIPNFMRFKFLIVAIPPLDIENSAATESLYTKISRHYNFKGNSAVFKIDDVFYFVTMENLVILDKNDYNYLKFRYAIKKEYGNIYNFLGLLKPYFGDAGGTFFFTILNETNNMKVNEEKNNPKTNYVNSTCVIPSKKYRIIFYFMNKYHYGTQKYYMPSDHIKKHLDIKSIEEIKNKDTANRTELTLDHSILQSNIAINLTFENRKKFFERIEDWYGFMAEMYQSLGVLTSQYYVRYDENKVILLIFDFNKIEINRMDTTNLDKIKFLSLVNLSSLTGEIFKLKIIHYCERYIEMKDLFMKFFAEIINISSFEQFQDSKISIYYHHRKSIADLYYLLLKTFPRITLRGEIIHDMVILDLIFNYKTEYFISRTDSHMNDFSLQSWFRTSEKFFFYFLRKISSQRNH